MSHTPFSKVEAYVNGRMLSFPLSVHSKKIFLVHPHVSPIKPHAHVSMW